MAYAAPGSTWGRHGSMCAAGAASGNLETVTPGNGDDLLRHLPRDGTAASLSLCCGRAPGLTEPDRVVREFKRRIGDTDPMMVGCRPCGRRTLSHGSSGGCDGRPSATGGPAGAGGGHPSGELGAVQAGAARSGGSRWPHGPVIRPVLAGSCGGPMTLRGNGGCPVGATIAGVYDFGGGTFDAAVAAKTATGFDLVGHPRGWSSWRHRLRRGGVPARARGHARRLRQLHDHLARCRWRRCIRRQRTRPAGVSYTRRSSPGCAAVAGRSRSPR